MIIYSEQLSNIVLPFRQVPSEIAFCPIVFSAPAYSSSLSLLSKFFLLSSAVHQGMITGLSSMPYAVGESLFTPLISVLTGSVVSLIKRLHEFC
jgi:hypothetical protein